MSLHDLDKNSPKMRLTPRINADDTALQRPAHNTLGTTYRTSAQTNSQRVAFKNGLILTYDEDNKISSAYGYIPEVSDMPVLIIAKAGYDVFIDLLGITPPTT